MWMTPEQVAIVRIDSGDDFTEKRDQLVLAIDVHDDRRRRRHVERLILPGACAVFLIESNQRLSLAAQRNDDGILVGNGTARVTTTHLSPVIFCPESVGPGDFAGFLVER